MADDERHLVRRAQARRDEQVALVLAIVVVSDDDDLAARKGGDGGGYALVAVIHLFVPHVIASAAKQSRLAASPGLLRRFAPRNDGLAAFACFEHTGAYHRAGRANGHAGGSPTWPRWRKK